MIAIPKEKLPNAMAGFKSVDKNLVYRVKRLFAENRNYVARAQCCRKVCSAIWCIHCEDSIDVLNYDLKHGYVLFGRILLIQRDVGITHGSPLALGLADMVLSVI